MIALSLLLLAAVPEARVQTVVDAIAQERCPRLFGMLSPEFQKAAPAESWPGWCQSVGRLEKLTPEESKDGWQNFKARSPGGDVMFSVAFDAKQRVAGLKVAALPVQVADTASTTELLETVRSQFGAPSLAAWIGRPGERLSSGAVGVRKLGDTTPVTEDDRWHLGSDTKAMTATLAALLVEEKKLSWSTTVGEVFKNAKDLHPKFRDVTLEELLTHRSGLPANLREWPVFSRSTPLLKRRHASAIAGLREAPAVARGEFLYSNLGYIVAGAMLERVTGQTWEALMKARIFTPLGMTGCGFGPPASSGTIDAPWGHDGSKPVPPGPGSDNPEELGPAGTVHCTLESWARFASLHVRGARGETTKLLNPAAFTKLHTGSPYAMGWLVSDGALMHDGSNTLFYASAWLAPARNVFVLVVTNAADDGAKKATAETMRLLQQRATALH